MNTTKEEGWIVTDPNCNQMYKELEKDKSYIFREERLWNPETQEHRIYLEVMDYQDYTREQILNACVSAFGYPAEEVERWINNGEQIPLILECLFELDETDGEYIN